MSQIVIGNMPNGKSVAADLDVLLRTRLLIQANSGGGKSFLLRRLAEQLFGKVQVLIIDPEGEFATLREKFGYVLVGQGGETPADVRSASLVAERLLELRASAVCDLFESFRKNPSERHEWVKAFLNAMLDAPKKLWHPVVVIVDEAHKFCPEKGAGESVASESMIGIATAGRKRGYCAVWATQRLGKVRKDSTADLLNRLVGPTFEDVDLERAAELLSISGTAEKKEFYGQMRLLEPGNFFALGRAIAKERILVRVGAVETTHPEIGSAKLIAEPPPAPEKVRALLPKLADLPKEVEEKARTEAEFRAEIRSLKAELAKAKKEQPKIDPQAIERAAEQAAAKRDTEWEGKLRSVRSAVMSGLERIVDEILGALHPGEFKAPGRPAPRLPAVAISAPKVFVREKRTTEPNGLTGPEQRILDAIAWMKSIGVQTPQQPAVAFLAGYTYGGGGFNNPRGSLNTKGLVQYLPGERIQLTLEGEALANETVVPLSAEELQKAVINRLPGPESKILQVLLNHYPEPISKEQCANESGYAPGSGGFNNPTGRLRSLGLIDYPAPGQVAALPLLFLE